MLVGLSAMVFGVAVGLGSFFADYPEIYEVMKFVGFAYVVFLAWRIYVASMNPLGAENSRPTSVWRATIFQWLNPKAWIVIATFVTTFVPVDGAPTTLALSAAIFVGFTMPGALLWIFLGTLLSRFLRSNLSRRVFSALMALALIGSMLPILFS
jgi:threonine/homoserine/homoserine lactone efflux protein